MLAYGFEPKRYGNSATMPKRVKFSSVEQQWIRAVAAEIPIQRKQYVHARTEITIHRDARARPVFGSPRHHQCSVPSEHIESRDACEPIPASNARNRLPSPLFYARQNLP